MSIVIGNSNWTIYSNNSLQKYRHGYLYHTQSLIRIHFEIIIDLPCAEIRCFVNQLTQSDLG